MIGSLLLLLSAPVALRYQAPVRCPPQEELVRQIEGLLLHPLESKVGIEGVDVALESRADGVHRLALTFEGGVAAQDRTLEDPDCAALIEAAALIIAIALDPEAMGETPPPVRGPPPPIDGLLAPGIPFAIPYPRLALGAAGGGDLGRGGPGLVPSVHGAVLWARFRFDLRLAFGVPRPAPGGEVALYAATGRACIDLLGLGAVELPFCPGAEVGLLERRREAGPVERPFWAAVVPALALHLVLSPHLAVHLEGQGVVPLTGPTAPDGSDLPRVGARVFLGGEVRFP